MSSSDDSERSTLPDGDTSERGDIIPARIVVNRYVRKKYACPDGHGVVTAEAPPGVIEGAKYEPSAYAWLATAKYADHQPLNLFFTIDEEQRLEKIPHVRHGAREEPDGDPELGSE